MNTHLRTLKTKVRAAFVTLTCGMLYAPVAYAKGSAAWATEGTDLSWDLASGLKSFGGPIVGVAIIAFGLFALLQGKIDMQRFMHLVMAGGIITVGPAMVTALIKLT
ncbi:hypothetical protein [Pseudovibrio sp. Tun.PSC04-5.I4]|uniref:hypothetical protein n=1 Tax=Pseudovibrio sp. Tun.PSC04-5.I4 TaxID=1798213 RepID=UPI0008803916|nr:hypothetical protein [Pseudovibrio sp. Tun.PSC04-5.I4]SDR49069.1 hypothetical protein SAMN04515695_6117 [Pseudovibrio sp. Tun.PSC04-5.I4]